MEHGAGHVAELVGTIIGLLLIAAATLAFTKRINLPFSVALVLVGIGLSYIAESGPLFLRPIAEYHISPEVILYVFLPTLIFESAFNLDARQLRQNLLPILTLAVPGLLLSTAIIGTFVWTVTSAILSSPIPLPAALLLGAILSATDPVAVIALFKQLGAPKRLTILVEGESLFNDATSIVLSKILLGVALAGYFTAETVFGGVLEFLGVFLGGIFIGWLAAIAVGLILGRVESDPFIETSLTTVLAYFSFLISEEVFHVSGVMATVAAGVTMGGWGRAKISPSVAGYLEHFWEYLAYVCNALIFLMVGLRVELTSLLHSIVPLVIVVIAMLISRAVVVFGLVPITGKLPNSHPINRGYQAVMFWGGLRGAIALAIVLHLPESFAYAETFIALVMGVVLFTLLVQGLSIGKLVHLFGLDQPPLSDRLAKADGVLSAKRRAQQRTLELQAGGFFSARIADMIQDRYKNSIKKILIYIETLRDTELNNEEEYRLLFLRSMALEKSLYYEMFSKGHLSEKVYRELDHSVNVQIDSIRDAGKIPDYTLYPPQEKQLIRTFMRSLSKTPKLSSFVEQIRSTHISRDYEKAWGRHQGCNRVLNELDEIVKIESVRPDVVEKVQGHYKGWNEAAGIRINVTTEQFPEFVSAMQERLAARLALHAEREAINEKSHSGSIPHGVAETMLDELAEELHDLRGREVEKLRVEPTELLRMVPFFQELPVEEFSSVAEQLCQRSYPSGEAILKQGERGRSLFLITRGVVRVSHKKDGMERDLATLMAGDFFGEMALLHCEPRIATCKAVTPCALYELKQDDFEELCKKHPSIQKALETAASERAASIS